MAKIVIIGAGSQVFSSRIISDILSYPKFRDSAITLMDIDKEALGRITTFTRTLVEQHGFKTKLETTTDRREALTSAILTIDETHRMVDEMFKAEPGYLKGFK